MKRLVSYFLVSCAGGCSVLMWQAVVDNDPIAALALFVVISVLSLLTTVAEKYE